MPFFDNGAVQKFPPVLGGTQPQTIDNGAQIVGTTPQGNPVMTPGGKPPQDTFAFPTSLGGRQGRLTDAAQRGAAFAAANPRAAQEMIARNPELARKMNNVLLAQQYPQAATALRAGADPNTLATIIAARARQAQGLGGLSGSFNQAAAGIPPASGGVPSAGAPTAAPTAASGITVNAPITNPALVRDAQGHQLQSTRDALERKMLTPVTRADGTQGQALDITKLTPEEQELYNAVVAEQGGSAATGAQAGGGPDAGEGSLGGPGVAGGMQGGPTGVGSTGAASSGGPF